MRILSLDVRNFRCFSHIELEFDQPTVIIAGSNGSGKTSVLEALHYCAHTRSFKTHRTQELIHHAAASHTGFYLASCVANAASYDTITIGVSTRARTLKLNQQPVSSYKHLKEVLDVVTISADDYEIITGAPSRRRSFFDHLLWQRDETYLPLMRRYRTVLNNRNALLMRNMTGCDQYILWTDQLLPLAHAIAKKRMQILETLNQHVSTLLATHFPHYNSLSLCYVPSMGYQEISTAQELLELFPELQRREYTYKRTLFGPHLDEFQCIFADQSTRTYASRGQQKLVLFLLKLSQAHFLSASSSRKLITLVDDMMTDFDPDTMSTMLHLLTETSSQLFLTSPHVTGPIAQFMNELVTSMSKNTAQTIILK